jgi:hypothetical protein
LDSEGKPYTLETYANHRTNDREKVDREDLDISRQLTEGCFYSLLQSLKSANRKNRGGLFAFHLEQFVDEMADKFGLADIYKDKAMAALAEQLARCVLEYDAANSTRYTLGKKPAPTPQKPQPSRKSKRKGGH